MYITRVNIQNIRCLTDETWDIKSEQAPGWHVILGENGSGKSSFLRAIALALVGPYESPALRLNFREWIQQHKSQAVVRLTLRRDTALDSISPTLFADGPHIPLPSRNAERGSIRVDLAAPPGASLYTADGRAEPAAMKAVWKSSEGWFAASYGPYRRFSGGADEFDTLWEANPRLARHLSVFNEGVALTEGLKWLITLHIDELEGHSDGSFLQQLKQFINQPGFLAHGARLIDVTAREVIFQDTDGAALPVEDFSDGYRSLLSMTFELIRELARAYGEQTLFCPQNPGVITSPGVVLIDEVDSHLHPTWQCRIGLWFREHFPNIQFIVTTHSAFVCQAAEHGTVWRLPAPGSGEKGAMVPDEDRERLIFGNVLEAYSTGLFGEGITRSEKSRELLDELATLNVKEITDGLNARETDRQHHLRMILPTSFGITNGKNGPSHRRSTHRSRAANHP